MKYLKRYNESNKKIEDDKKLATQYAKKLEQDYAKKSEEVEQYIEDVLAELIDYNLVHTVINKKPHWVGGYDVNRVSRWFKGEIKIIIGKESYREFTLIDSKNTILHAISYLKENGYVLGPNEWIKNGFLREDINDALSSTDMRKSFELLFVYKGVCPAPKVLCESRNYDYIKNDIEDIFAYISDIGLRVVEQIQEEEILVYIVPGVQLSGKHTYHLTDIKNEVNHFISQMQENGHKLIVARYRLCGPRKSNYRWVTLWNGIEYHDTKKVDSRRIANQSPTSDIFDVQDNDFDTMVVDSFELKFSK